MDMDETGMMEAEYWLHKDLDKTGKMGRLETEEREEEQAGWEGGLAARGLVGMDESEEWDGIIRRGKSRKLWAVSPSTPKFASSTTSDLVLVNCIVARISLVFSRFIFSFLFGTLIVRTCLLRSLKTCFEMRWASHSLTGRSSPSFLTNSPNIIVQVSID